MEVHNKYMLRCIELAKNGLSYVAPNPMVGSVITSENTIIGEGYHTHFGAPHAEVNAINSVKEKSLLKNATLYVNLEPCAHFGKTPPCADLIIENKIPNVVIGCLDTFSEVAGKGVAKLKKAGVNVTVGVLENEALALNNRFFTFHNKKRPFIILKWAQSLDGFIDRTRTLEENPSLISNRLSKRLSHLWRSQENAIMVGTNTVKMDNPSLTVRELNGVNPLRIIIDKNLTIPQNNNVFNNEASSVIFNAQKTKKRDNIDFVKINFDAAIIPQILNHLHNLEIQSVIVEGGTFLINSFIEKDVWDEARIFMGNKIINDGVKAPIMPKGNAKVEDLDDNKLITIVKS